MNILRYMCYSNISKRLFHRLDTFRDSSTCCVYQQHLMCSKNVLVIVYYCLFLLLTVWVSAIVLSSSQSHFHMRVWSAVAYHGFDHHGGASLENVWGVVWNNLFWSHILQHASDLDQCLILISALTFGIEHWLIPCLFDRNFLPSTAGLCHTQFMLLWQWSVFWSLSLQQHFVSFCFSC